jgi:hypothetical protein
MKRVAGALTAQPDVAAGSLDVDLDSLCVSSADSHAPAAVQRDVADIAARALVVCLFTMMVVRIGLDFLQTGRVTGLLLLGSEALVVVLTLVRRTPALVDRSIRARVLTTLSMLGPPIVRPTGAIGLVPDVTTVLVSACGLLVVILGKLSLGRSFGLMPANRGIVSTGFYRVVRHPIYLGYLITHFAFVAANPTLWNLAVLVTSDIALMARAVCEERTLARDEAYRNYQQLVRWRVVPGVF